LRWRLQERVREEKELRLLAKLREGRDMEGKGSSLADETIPKFATPFAKEVAGLNLMPQGPINSQLCKRCT
jgi:hypothetical protein